MYRRFIPTLPFVVFFFFNDTATTEIYTLSLHDALPIYERQERRPDADRRDHARRHPAPHHAVLRPLGRADPDGDRKSTRLNSSHGYISYAVFCLKKKNHNRPDDPLVRLAGDDLHPNPPA